MRDKPATEHKNAWMAMSVESLVDRLIIRARDTGGCWTRAGFDATKEFETPLRAELLRRLEAGNVARAETERLKMENTALRSLARSVFINATHDFSCKANCPRGDYTCWLTDWRAEYVLQTGDNPVLDDPEDHP